MKTLRDLWLRNATLYADKPAVILAGTTLTYGEIVGQAHRLASALHKLGLEKQDRIAFLGRNRTEWFPYYAACELHGYIASTLNFRLTVPELAYIIDDARPAILIFEEDYVETVALLRPLLAPKPTFVCIGKAPEWALEWDTLVAGGDPLGPDLAPTADDGVRLIYTSGTTGKPKGVLRSQAADLALARICASTAEMDERVRELVMMPLFHVGAQSMASAAHYVGGTVVLHRDFDPQAILASIEQNRVSVIHLTPTILQALLDHPGVDSVDLSSLRTIYYAAAAMPVPLLERGLRKFGPLFINCYGSTEAGAAIVLDRECHVPDGTERFTERLGSLGRAHADAQVRIIGDDWSDRPIGDVGEIALATAGMMSGYWNNPDKTADVLRDGWLKTGDIGRMDEHGFVYLIDRKADMVISGGENIYSREVEDALMRHPAIGSAAVIGIPDAHWGEAVLAVVVAATGSAVDDEELIRHCTQLIARYKVPKTFRFVQEMPLLANGKIDKPSLRRIYASRNTDSDTMPDRRGSHGK